MRLREFVVWHAAHVLRRGTAFFDGCCCFGIAARNRFFDAAALQLVVAAVASSSSSSSVLVLREMVVGWSFARIEKDEMELYFTELLLEIALTMKTLPPHNPLSGTHIAVQSIDIIEITFTYEKDEAAF